MILSHSPYLKVPHLVWFHETFEPIFKGSYSVSKKYVLNIEETYLGVFRENFRIILEKRFCRTLVNSWAREFAIYIFLA